ncbi:exosortase-associated EpsI family protein [Candidatus Desantisbacteria bacterium]|nr:exosortase-associated EpsI family protein [Candidatus Desantisbacteria bacterium]
MKINKSNIRDMTLVILILAVTLYVFSNPINKQSAQEKINLTEAIPPFFKDWRSKTYDMSDYNDQWQSINEILVRTYSKNGISSSSESGLIRLNFILEYSSDLRKNFSFHFPENCHRASGNEVDFFEPLEIKLTTNKSIKAKCLYIKGMENSTEKNDKVVVYWLAIDNKQYYQTFYIKLNQMLAGLLKKSNRGFLIRFDYYDGLEYKEENIKKAKEVISFFIKDLYNTLDDEKRKALFGVESI